MEFIVAGGEAASAEGATHRRKSLKNQRDFRGPQMPFYFQQFAAARRMAICTATHPTARMRRGGKFEESDEK
ncbi:MAG: hypothetical protein KIT09_03510 [Bryobacteraceae bacterium]|nr:hypothetical protein [Bryobacteraceae bacterium]